MIRRTSQAIREQRLPKDGKLAALVNADKELGKEIKLQHTPTLYVVSNRHSGKPFVEVVDRSQLYALIDEMMKD